MGSGWDFQRPFSRTAWMAGTYAMGRKRLRRSCSHWASQAEKGWVESAVRNSISADIQGQYRRMHNESKIRGDKNLTTDEHGLGKGRTLAANRGERTRIR